MDTFSNLMLGFSVAFTPINLLYCFIGVLLGTVVGVLPGLGVAATMALLLPFTFYLNATTALIMLAGIWYGSMYGGSTTAILLRIPGEVGSIMTTIDGYEMAKQGRAGAALGIAAFGSFIAGTFGIVALMFLAPPLAEIAIKFGPPEYFGLTLIGLTLVSFLAKGSKLKALLTAVAGLFLASIGLDPVRSVPRFTFGNIELMSGLELVAIAMGLFGIAEVFCMIEEEIKTEGTAKAPKGFFSYLPNKKDWKDSAAPITRGSIAGFFLGVMPGVGTAIVSFVSYALEKSMSKHPERFGRGAIEGVAGPESANNSATAGGFIPLLSLGIPNNVITALMLGAFMIHGIRPGPTFVAERPQMFWGIVSSMYIGNIMLLILNLPLIGMWVKLMKMSKPYLIALILFVCLVGAYASGNNVVDIYVMLIFGIIGYIMRKFELEEAPLLLAFILGPMIENSLRQSMVMGNGSFMIFYQRPISSVLVSIAIILYITPLVQFIIRRSRSVKKAKSAS
jgi:putative tricarboxylic transport membrane protein